MNTQESTAASANGQADPASAVEGRLGQVLTLIHRILPRLDEPGRAGDVQTALRRAVNLLESARLAHEHETSPSATGSAQKVATGVEPEIAAVIAAAVAVLINRPYRLISVQPAATPVPHLNVWALEGRTEIFQSHRIR